MSFRFFEHKADIGIEGIGSTVEKAFEEAAKALFEIQFDIKKVKTAKRIKISCNASTLEELFVEWLNRLLAEASINEMAFSAFKIEKIKNKENKFNLRGYAFGERIQTRHHPKTEVKAATYAELSVVKKKNKYIAKCIVDV